MQKPVSVNVCSWVAPDVTLIDGTVVKSDSEAWRFECEARHILRLPTLEARKGMLKMIEGRRGLPARRNLEEKIWEIWNHERQKRNL